MSDTSTGAVSASATTNEIGSTTETQGANTTEKGIANQQADAKPLTQAQKEKFKIKVDGEEFEEEIDLSDKESLRKRFQLAKAYEKRGGEAVAAKRKAMELIKNFENPDSLRSFLKTHPQGKAIAEQILLEQIQDQMMSPEEKQRRATESELETLRREKKEREEAQMKQAQAAKEAEYAENYQKTIIGALEKSGLPKTPELVKRMASIMHKNISLGLELDADDLAAEVKKEYTGLVGSTLKDASVEQLLTILTPEQIKQLRLHAVKELQAKQSGFNKPAMKSTQNSQASADNGPMTIDQWKEQLDKKWS